MYSEEYEEDDEGMEEGELQSGEDDVAGDSPQQGGSELPLVSSLEEQEAQSGPPSAEQGSSSPVEQSTDGTPGDGIREESSSLSATDFPPPTSSQMSSTQVRSCISRL